MLFRLGDRGSGYYGFLFRKGVCAVLNLMPVGYLGKRLTAQLPVLSRLNMNDWISGESVLNLSFCRR